MTLRLHTPSFLMTRSRLDTEMVLPQEPLAAALAQQGQRQVAMAVAVVALQPLEMEAQAAQALNLAVAAAEAAVAEAVQHREQAESVETDE